MKKTEKEKKEDIVIDDTTAGDDYLPFDKPEPDNKSQNTQTRKTTSSLKK